MNIHAIEITDYNVSDIDMLDKINPYQLNIGKVTSDGAYYNNAGTQALNDKDITPVIPPQSHSKVYGLDIIISDGFDAINDAQSL